MRRVFNILAIFLVSLIGFRAVQAQSAVVFDRLRIEIWPEYDRPDVLVIYRMVLGPQVSLPAQVSIRIPREAGAPFSLAWEDMDGLLYNLAYTTEVQEEWLKISFTTPTSSLQVEYYDPRLTREETNRSFEFFWNGDFSVNALSVSVQQPAGAENMQVFPGFGPGETKEDGLVYYTNTIGTVSAGTTFRVNLAYQKSDDQLSVGLQSVQPVQPLDGSAPGRFDSRIILPWAMGGLGILLLVGGVVWFILYRGRDGGSKKNRRRHPASPARKESPGATSDERVYCSQCGRRASPGDLFCRTCGTRLRID